ncbi:MAG: NADH-quinone oxidoreductase subunit C, partial [Thermomonas sp.]
MTALAQELAARFGEAAVQVAQPRGEVTLEVPAADWLGACTALRDAFGFDTFIDLCGVDYLGYGSDEWDTDVSSEGFSRGVEGQGPGRFAWGERPSHQAAQPLAEAPDAAGPRRFAVVLHLLSIARNQRLRVRCFTADDGLPVVASVMPVWPGANWFEREAFDRSRVDMIRGYAEHDGCRRAFLLGYFGEAYTPPCGNCDRCDE